MPYYVIMFLTPLRHFASFYIITLFDFILIDDVASRHISFRRYFTLFDVTTLFYVIYGMALFTLVDAIALFNVVLSNFTEWRFTLFYVILRFDVILLYFTLTILCHYNIWRNNAMQRYFTLCYMMPFEFIMLACVIFTSLRYLTKFHVLTLFAFS